MAQAIPRIPTSVDRFVARLTNRFNIPAQPLHSIACGCSQHEPTQGTCEHELADHFSYPFSIHQSRQPYGPVMHVKHQK